MENQTLPLNNVFSNKKWLTHGYPPDTCTYHQFKTFSELINQHIIILSRKQESPYEAQADLEILFFCLDLGSADITSMYHHIQPYMHGHGQINRKEVGKKGRNKAKRTIRSLVDVFLHAFSTWHLPRICFSCFCVNKINYLNESFRVSSTYNVNLLSVAGFLNEIQNLRAFLSFPPSSTIKPLQDELIHFYTLAPLTVVSIYLGMRALWILQIRFNSILNAIPVQ